MKKIHIDSRIVILAIVSTLIKIVLGCVLELDNLSEWFLIVLADYNVCSRTISVQLIVYIMEFVCLFYIIVLEVIDTLKNKSIYVFTRIDKRKQFLLKEYLKLVLNVIVYYVLSVIVMIAVYIIKGNNIGDITQVVVAIIEILSCKICYQVMILIVCIVCGLYWDEMHIMLIYLFIKIVSVLSVYNVMDTNTKVIKYNPLLQDIYVLKKYDGNNEVLKNIYYIWNDGCSNVLSLLYIIIVLCVIMSVSVKLYEKKEFI